MKNLPNRKERQEINELKDEIKRLTDSTKKKAQNNKLASERLKKKLVDIREKNEELLGEKDMLLTLVNDLRGKLD